MVVILADMSLPKSLQVNGCFDLRFLSVFSDITKELSEIKKTGDMAKLVYLEPVKLLAQCLQKGMTQFESTDLLAELLTNVVEFFRSNRDILQLVSFQKTTMESLGLNKAQIDFIQSTCCVIEPIYELAAECLINRSNKLSKIIGTIEACSSGEIQRERGIDIDAVLLEISTKFAEYNQQKIDYGVLSKDCSSLKSELALKSKDIKNKIVYIDSLTERSELKLNKLREENQTLINSFFNAQETIELQLETIQGLKQTIKEIDADRENLKSAYAIESNKIKKELKSLIASHKEVTQFNHELSIELQDTLDDVNQQRLTIVKLTDELKKSDAHKKWLLFSLKNLNSKHWEKSLWFRRKIRKEARLIFSSGLFDSKFYLDRASDIELSRVSPAQHYLLFGAYEGSNPSANFDPLYYIARYNDVAEAGVEALMHFIKFGQNENRNGNPSQKLLSPPTMDNKGE